jgi:hypothetical protein
MRSIQNSKLKIQNSVHSAFRGFCLLLLAAISLAVTGCTSLTYSLKSGSIPPDIKSISVQNFINEAGGPSSLGQNLTEKIRSYYQQNSRLAVLKNNGDWQLEGRITGYTVSPVAPGAVAGQTQTTGGANLNRLTITTSVKFVNTKKPKADKENFESNFSFYQDFSQTQSLSQIEGELVESILNQIVLDIFTKTTSNW